MALAQTLGLFPHIQLNWGSDPLSGSSTLSFNLQTVLVRLATLCLAVSMAGVGLETRFSALRRTSLKPLLAAGIAATIIAVFGLFAALAIP